MYKTSPLYQRIQLRTDTEKEYLLCLVNFCLKSSYHTHTTFFPSVQVSNFKIISTILSVNHVELNRKWDNIILCNLRELMVKILFTKICFSFAI